MRDFKFRAWSLLSKAYIDLWDIPYNEIFCKTPDTRPLIIEQYTGQKDKNNKDIYEGDIIAAHNRYYLVEWNNDDCCFDPLCEYILASDCDIIGNINENPELIKS